MAYDLHGSWERTTGHHSALYPRQGEQGAAAELNVVSGRGGAAPAPVWPPLLSLEAPKEGLAGFRKVAGGGERLSGQSPHPLAQVWRWVGLPAASPSPAEQDAHLSEAQAT